MKVSFIFAWYDLWIGLYYDRERSWLYILPIPMVGIILKLPQRRYWMLSFYDQSVIGSTDESEREHNIVKEGCLTEPYWAHNGETRPLFGPDRHNRST